MGHYTTPILNFSLNLEILQLQVALSMTFLVAAVVNFSLDLAFQVSERRKCLEKNPLAQGKLPQIPLIASLG